jgi:hypothetical protein
MKRLSQERKKVPEKIRGHGYNVQTQQQGGKELENITLLKNQLEKLYKIKKH